ncbi:glutathione S-transferase family protein [Comamonas terrigena]|uniref:glutathione S-transferase family protein n=1 Tax=Comamonas terrigena TaxID=32013 RepID=UPI0024488A5A|nr:glutathione S-transferase family protein [Comamonas terrigena]MDH1500142.1 glutathione S-transferase family protein [Comamonas terrigena]
MLQLYIGNKNYSSWSLRPWLVLRQLGIPFEEMKVRFDSFAPDSHFKQTMLGLTPTGKLPLLVDDGLAIWDTLAITEYLAERFPQAGVWPTPVADRARARSLCAEMHSGFTALRSHCPMNVEAHLPEVGARIWAEQAGVRDDVYRLIDMWGQQLSTHGGPLLFGNFCAADAFFAPVCLRLDRYALPLPQHIQPYVQRVLALPSVREWTRAALEEKDFREFEEPYRTASGMLAERSLPQP